MSRNLLGGIPAGTNEGTSERIPKGIHGEIPGGTVGEIPKGILGGLKQGFKETATAASAKITIMVSS